MKHIIVGTDRPGSNSRRIADLVHGLYSELGEEVAVLDLQTISAGFREGSQYGNVTHPTLKEAVDAVDKSDGLILVVPEYNGSMPGALKLFIDHLKYPDSFEHRPICFVGLGGMFGGLRPVEHLQQVFGYRNAFIFPDRIFIMNVWNHFKKSDTNPEGKFQDPLILDLLKKQARGFQAFTECLKSARLHALSKK